MVDWSFTQQSIMQSACQMQADFSDSLFMLRNKALEQMDTEQMTLRDFFAGYVLMGSGFDFQNDGSVEYMESCAQRAFRMADAMLKERQEGE